MTNARLANRQACPRGGNPPSAAENTSPANAVPRIARRSALAIGAGLLIAPLASRPAAAAGAMAVVNDTQYDAYTVLGAYSEFGTFMNLLEQSGLAGEARSAENVTLFVPTNAAFAKYPTYLQMLIPGGSQSFPDTRKLIEYVRNHVVAGIYTPDQFLGRKLSLVSMAGQSVVIDGAGSGPPTVTYHPRRGQTVTADIPGQPIRASNAMIYPINDPILKY